MAGFTAKDVQALRKETGAGMLDAKRALTEANGDVEAARQWLRVNGLAGISARQGRESSEGAVALAESAGTVAMVELRCETDFVAKSDEFVNFAAELAAAVADEGEEAAASRGDELERLRVSLRENIQVGRVVRFATGAGGRVGSYLHVQSGRGVNGVIVEVDGADGDLAHDVALHIAFARPAYVSRDEVPTDDVAGERKTIEEIVRKEGKPEAAWPKIIEGRLASWYRERCLLDQPFVRDDKRKVAEMLGGATVVRFAQIVVGS